MIASEASSNDNTCEFRGNLDELHIHQTKNVYESPIVLCGSEIRFCENHY